MASISGRPRDDAVYSIFDDVAAAEIAFSVSGTRNEQLVLTYSKMVGGMPDFISASAQRKLNTNTSKLG